MNSFSYYLIYASYFSILIPIYYYLKRRSNLKFRAINVLAIVFFASALADLLSYLAVKQHRSNLNLPIGNAHFIIRFILLCSVYHYLHARNSFFRQKKIALLLILAFILGWAFITLYEQPFNEFQGYSAGLTSILLFPLSCYFFAYMAQHYKDLLTEEHSDDDASYVPVQYWFNMAVFYYYSLNFIVFLLSTYAFNELDTEKAQILWAFHNMNNIITNLMFARFVYFIGKYGFRNRRKQIAKADSKPEYY